MVIILLQTSGCIKREDLNRPLDADEIFIYSAIIDSLFNDSYEKVFINEKTLSVMRFIKKTSLSEHLFEEEPAEYFRKFFLEKKCVVSEELIENYIEFNRQKFPLFDKLKLNREIGYAPHLSIYAFSRGTTPKHEQLKKALNDKIKFGVISFSHISFAEDKTEAMLEVNIHRRNRGETFYSFLKKVNRDWQFLPNCYVYGPYKVKD